MKLPFSNLNMEIDTFQPEIEVLINQSPVNGEIVQPEATVNKSRRNFMIAFGLGMLGVPMLACFSKVVIPSDCKDKIAARGVGNNILDAGLGDANAQAAVDQACK